MSDAEHWDARYRGELGARRSEPDPFVLEALERLGPAKSRTALDVAAGLGRHALLLAERGYRVTAWDVSAVALEIASQRAEERGLSVELLAVDLTGPLPEARFELVVVADYLDRSLLSRLGELLAPGGHAIVTTFTADFPGVHPSPRFRLTRGELASGLVGLQTILLTEAGGRAGLLATRGKLGTPRTVEGE